MEPERWRRIEELYHSALQVAADQRAAFLKDKCQDDEQLRKEIESLLSYETSASSFIESPAFGVAAKLMAKDEAGEQLSDPIVAGAISTRFRILEKLGGGGMGIVYKAEDTKLRRMVALKFLPPELSRDAQALERFQREAYAASALNHPNICTVYDVDEYQGQPFIAMEFLQGKTLEQHAQTHPLPTSELLNLAIQVSGALDAAHTRGIIHRDIKPSNIFVTAHGQPKILDFGVAKLQGSEISDQPLSSSEQAVSQREWNPNLTLTRTGMALGTAGYMSPEQIRGEKLDVRTDLFSFGLVLYEMATGQRAFKGNTGPELHNAIIEQSPIPPRQLNPNLPTKIENIIQRALKKNREARYQSAAEIRTDLLSAKREAEHRPRWRELMAGAVALLLVTTAIFWYFDFRQRRSQPLAEPKLTQLTFNSFEDRVTSGTISPNGKYLAYADINGMYIKNIETGAIQAIRQPEGLNSRNIQWEVGAWFPDSARVLANAHPSADDPNLWSSEDSSIWMVSLQGGARKLRDKATAYSVSPDGSSISFGANKGKPGDREIWLMTPNGDQAHELFEADEKSSICCLAFLPGGQRVSYFVIDQSGGRLVARDLAGGPVVALLAPSETQKIDDFSPWLPDGRVLYSVKESGTGLFPLTSNYWAMRLDPRTGHIIEKPTQLTHQTDSWMNTSSVTADGKRLAFMKQAMHMTSYMGDLAAGGTRILNLRHFPSTESSVAAADWTPDGKQLINASTRPGDHQIYKQQLDEETQAPLIAEGFGRNSRVTPDGKWVLYFGTGDPAIPVDRRALPVMRVSIDGGPPEALFTAKPRGLITCARPPSMLCVIGEPSEDGKELVVSALDAVKGRGPELSRFALDPSDNSWWIDLSPDGSRIAALRTKRGPIYILSLRGRPLQELKVKGWSNGDEPTWAADEKGLYFSADVRGGKVLSYVDFRGNAHVVWNSPGATNETFARPSPDGRHLLIQTWTRNDNLWMMENF
jgi:eukaryotic-like serine/threonine-protein kinase